MKLFIFIFLNITNVIYSQSLTLNGFVYNEENIPLDNVSVYIDKTNEGTITNEEGKFKFIIDNKNSELTFSFIGYKTTKIDINTIKDYSNLEVILIPYEDTLEEVVISNGPISDLLDRIIQKSKNKLKKSAILIAYNREILKTDSTYCFFADGLSQYHLQGERKNIRSKMYIEKNRVINVGCNDLDKFIKSNPFGYNVNELVEESFKKNRFLNLVFKREDMYEFSLKTKTFDNQVTHNIIEFEPKSNNITGYLFNGYVIYDTKSELILELYLKKASNKLEHAFELQSFIFDFSAIDIEQKINYRIDGEKYILVYNKGYRKYYIGNILGRKYNKTYTFFNDLTVLKYEEGVYNFDKKKRFNDDFIFSLGNKYSNPFWENISISMTEEQKFFHEFIKE